MAELTETRPGGVVHEADCLVGVLTLLDVGDDSRHGAASRVPVTRCFCRCPEVEA